jgi:hypothetical protein
MGVSRVIVALVGTAREHDCSVVDLSLLDERVCEIAVQVAGGEIEAPRVAGLESLTALAFRFGQLARYRNSCDRKILATARATTEPRRCASSSAWS